MDAKSVPAKRPKRGAGGLPRAAAILLFTAAGVALIHSAVLWVASFGMTWLIEENFAVMSRDALTAASFVFLGIALCKADEKKDVLLFAAAVSFTFAAFYTLFATFGAFIASLFYLKRSAGPILYLAAEAFLFSASVVLLRLCAKRAFGRGTSRRIGALVLTAAFGAAFLVLTVIAARTGITWLTGRYIRYAFGLSFGAYERLKFYTDALDLLSAILTPAVLVLAAAAVASEKTKSAPVSGDALPEERAGLVIQDVQKPSI